ncbi:putative disease resistance protein At1g50180 [Dioscorea cayenensis subsp. rotundata]|uniref:Disease resistance protein At1g50180 n=1 Tax=Dioscorea cayennensis subsp. rotundata TaxID=55577 RepID=A0AB40B015_DIOCR|nr:putative disease resistance protein At1g50180 [Dioscorea cayenensis subsp. rotundata]
MADAAVGSLVRKLGDLLVQEAINLHGVSDQVEWLKRELETMHRHKVHVDVQGIKTRLQELSRSREVYDISNIGTTSQYRSPGEIPILPQLRDDIDMVGFDDEKKKIVLELVNEEKTNRSVISIVATPSADTIQDLSVAISEKLKKGKYLIVLDDVWKRDVWNELLKVFPDVNNGSRVVITTRFKNVINIADPTTKLHKLRYLNEKESWELFLRKVFPRQDIETCCPTCLLDCTHQLVQRCGGLPLALVVLGGLVSTKPQTQDAWHKFVASIA